MKIVSDENIIRYLNENLSRDSIVSKFQSSLLKGLINYEKDPSSIVPPRTVQTSNTENSDSTHLFMPCIAPNEVGIKLISGGPSNSQKGLGFQGCILILDEFSGSLQGVLNAKTITAFRTALASTLGLVKVFDPYGKENDIPAVISVFGVGLQAYWHIKLSLILYEGKVNHVNIVNRSMNNAQELGARLSKEFPNTTFESHLYGEPHQLTTIQSRVSQSSIIFGCLPSTETVIKKCYINPEPSKKKYISLIGSYKPHMIELDLDFITPNYKNSSSSPKIIVDSKEHTLHEAGELIQAKIGADQLLEITELYSENVDPRDYTTSSNVVVLKIVGLSVMDITIANLIIQDILEGKAINIENF